MCRAHVCPSHQSHDPRSSLQQSTIRVTSFILLQKCTHKLVHVGTLLDELYRMHEVRGGWSHVPNDIIHVARVIIANRLVVPPPFANRGNFLSVVAMKHNTNWFLMTLASQSMSKCIERGTMRLYTCIYESCSDHSNFSSNYYFYSLKTFCCGNTSKHIPNSQTVSLQN